MDFLEKLNYLMNKNNLNKSTLSKSCDIPYTTIDGWYKKGYEGLKLTTLRKLSNFFGTPLDFWASDNINNSNIANINSIMVRQDLSDQEKDILTKFNLLDDAERKSIETIIDSMYLKNLNKN